LQGQIATRQMRPAGTFDPALVQLVREASLAHGHEAITLDTITRCDPRRVVLPELAALAERGPPPPRGRRGPTSEIDELHATIPCASCSA
jgi:hypothetical protein